MKKTLLYTAIILGLLLPPMILRAQCTPGDEITCPDPENNGEICPETLPNAVVDQPYNQEFTILAPPQYVVDSSAGIIIDLHHITLKSIDNMPEGITWQTNADDSVFMVGTYYCVLLEGTPTIKGDYPLRIVVDVYIPGILGSPPINVATVTDSTSLLIHVTDPSGTSEIIANSTLSCAPNPFLNEVEIALDCKNQGPATLEIHSILGKAIEIAPILLQAGMNKISYDGAGLQPGIYFLSIRTAEGTVTQRIIKSN